MAITDDTLAKAGVSDPFDTRISTLEGRNTGYMKESADVASKQRDVSAEEERLIRERGAATAAPRAALAKKAGEVPDTTINEEPTPGYKRPTMDPGELKEAYGILMAASFLVGSVSRSPYNAGLQAMTGALTGFMKQDEKMVDESIKVFDTSLAAIKERNTQKRRAVDDAWKKYSNDLVGLKTQLELIAAQYDDQIALQTARSKSLTDTQKVIDANERSTEAAIVKLEQVRANVENARARQAEARARYEQAEERLQLARDKAAGKTEQAETAATRAVAVIDEMQTLLQSSSGITGVVGMARRPMESIATTFGADEGSAHKYESLARELQNILRQTEEFRYKGRTLSKEVADRDVMVRGMKIGDTDKISSDQLQHLRNMLTGQGTGFQAPEGQEPRAETKTLNGKTYTKIKGQWFESDVRVTPR